MKGVYWRQPKNLLEVSFDSGSEVKKIISGENRVVSIHDNFSNLIYNLKLDVSYCSSVTLLKRKFVEGNKINYLEVVLGEKLTDEILNFERSFFVKERDDFPYNLNFNPLKR